MPKSRRQKNKRLRRQYTRKTRKNDAKRWLLRSNSLPENLVKAYGERYGISEGNAHIELLELGYDEDIQIQGYEQDGIEWEYKYDGFLGEMFVVPKGTPDWELPDYW